ncbi:MAG: alpha-glucan family phosphorylase, partial [Phycisphaerales bacterium]|nr:alpha-glucan family phosphorylase [Phycisphaerales bacterium]
MPATAARRARKTTSLDRAACLAHNLWWTWNPGAGRLFESIDPAQWEATNHNPLATLQAIDETRRRTLVDDPDFAAAVDAVEADLSRYLDARPWFARTARGAAGSLQVAYFCMEYAVHESVPLYAGGLGVLAGDHLKSASDLGIPLVGVGILWKYGYYRQEIRLDGEVRVLYPEHRFDQLPVTDTGRTITVPIGKAKVKARIWKMLVGRVELLLLDTDLPANKPADRRLTHHLYGGDRVDRIRQEILLGIGGLRA